MNKLVLLSFFLFGATGIAAAGNETRTHTFNLSGSHHGKGDVTGPFFVMLDLKRQFPNDRLIAIVDERSKAIIEGIFDDNLENIALEYGVIFYSQDAQSQVSKSDFSFELFVGGRRNSDFRKAFFNKPDTVIFVSDTMHGEALDEVLGQDFTLYFKPPGIGKDRSGLVKSPILDRFLSKSRNILKIIAMSAFADASIKYLIANSDGENLRLSFLYGVHNELLNRKTKGQTSAYLDAIESSHPGMAIIVFTPNSEDELRRASVASNRILNLSQLNQRGALEKKVFLLSLPNLSDFQFLSLIALANLPILIEGNTAVCQAILLAKEFLMYRSPWNAPMIRDLLVLDAEMDSNLYQDVYSSNVKNDDAHHPLPKFNNYLNKSGRFFQHLTLSFNQEYFASKLAFIVKLTAEISDQAEPNYKILSREIRKSTEDEYLEYSLNYDAYRRGKISEADFLDVRNDFNVRGLDWRHIENRLFAKVEPSSYKIKETALEQSIDKAFFINLDRSVDRRKHMESLANRVPVRLERFAAVDGSLFRGQYEMQMQRSKNQTLRYNGDTFSYNFEPDAHSNVMTAGELGIYLSNYYLLKQIVHNSYRRTLVLEDDVMLPETFSNDLKQYFTLVPKDWDILYLYCNQLNWWGCKPTELSSSGSQKIGRLQEKCCPGAVASIISLQGAKKMLNNIFPIRKPIDLYTGHDLIGDESLSFRAYCVTPDQIRISDVPSDIDALGQRQ